MQNNFDYLALSLLLILVWEYFAPYRFGVEIRSRWLINFSMYFVNIVLRILIFVPVFTTIGTHSIFSLLSILSNFNLTSKIILTVLLIDAYYYLLHRGMHHVKFFWRVHLVHHSDSELDVSTNFRHHPLEMIITTIAIGVFYFIIRLPIEGIVVYGVLNSIIQVWHHGNIRMPEKIDKFLQVAVITPRLHQLHHSAFMKETNSNYGAIFSIWDRLCGTLCVEHSVNLKFRYGLEYFREEEQKSFKNVLLQPLFYKPNSH
jgi:sterol desaturase/sphingolipid hydroxylase (fatty acid hydroxylase superfamily)